MFVCKCFAEVKFGLNKCRCNSLPICTKANSKDKSALDLSHFVCARLFHTDSDYIHFKTKTASN